MEYYLTVRKGEILQFASTWKDRSGVRKENTRLLFKLGYKEMLITIFQGNKP